MANSNVPSTNQPAVHRRRHLLRSAAFFVPTLLAACSSGQPKAAAVPTARPTERPPTPTTPPPTPTPVVNSPLSGHRVEDPSSVWRRIVAVKIDNAPLARPQFGLGVADVVYEQLAEGGLTRFLALFLEQDPERIGPVRSARLTDIYLGQEWDFLLAYAGAGRTTGRLLGEALIPLFKAPELGEPLEGTPFARDPRRPIPHNMFVSVPKVREAAGKDPGLAPDVEIRPLPFHDPPAELGSVRRINMPYVPAAAVSWIYDEGANAWKRSMAGVPHVDALNGQQIQADNVVVQYAQIFTAANVEPDSAGNPVLDTVLRGENKLRVFHSGHTFEGTWAKEHDRAKTQYFLDSGDPMPFRPGRVWFHIVPTDFRASWGA
ncbi:MAG: DUF3048 domain-containing protein [Chloroflexi bacterium]|nr:DUF3048 domain-containing protein [Chloroflexota bacterium]